MNLYKEIEYIRSQVKAMICATHNQCSAQDI